MIRELIEERLDSLDAGQGRWPAASPRPRRSSSRSALDGRRSSSPHARSRAANTSGSRRSIGGSRVAGKAEHVQAPRRGETEPGDVRMQASLDRLASHEPGRFELPGPPAVRRDGHVPLDQLAASVALEVVFVDRPVEVGTRARRARRRGARAPCPRAIRVAHPSSDRTTGSSPRPNLGTPSAGSRVPAAPARPARARASRARSPRRTTRSGTAAASSGRPGAHRARPHAAHVRPPIDSRPRPPRRHRARAAPRPRSRARIRRRALGSRGRSATADMRRHQRSTSHACTARSPTGRHVTKGHDRARSSSRRMRAAAARSQGYERTSCSTGMHRRRARRQYRRCDHTLYSRLLRRGVVRRSARVADSDGRRRARSLRRPRPSPSSCKARDGATAAAWASGARSATRSRDGPAARSSITTTAARRWARSTRTASCACGCCVRTTST